MAADGRIVGMFGIEACGADRTKLRRMHRVGDLDCDEVARAVRSDNAEQRSCLDREIDCVNRNESAE